jgi:hypothetical protein
MSWYTESRTAEDRRRETPEEEARAAMQEAADERAETREEALERIHQHGGIDEEYEAYCAQKQDEEWEAGQAKGTAPKYPYIRVRLVGTDGNAFAVLGKVLGALRRAGVSDCDRIAFQKAATAGDYDHLLATVMATVEVE